MQLLQILDGCDFVPVQRNRGIDAIVNVPNQNAIAFIRIQRKGEALGEVIRALIQAGRGKNASLLIVIQTEESSQSDAVNKISKKVRVIEAASLTIQKILRALSSD